MKKIINKNSPKSVNISGDVNAPIFINYGEIHYNNNENKYVNHGEVQYTKSKYKYKSIVTSDKYKENKKISSYHEQEGDFYRENDQIDKAFNEYAKGGKYGNEACVFFCCQILSEYYNEDNLSLMNYYSLQLEQILLNKKSHDILYALGLGIIGIISAQLREFQRAKMYLEASINCKFEISSMIAEHTLNTMRDNNRI